MTKRLYRIPDQGQLTGVAAGLAAYFNIDPTIVRVLFVVGAFLTDGLAVLAYFILAVVLPVKSSGAASFSERIQTVVEDISGNAATNRLRNWVGGALIIFGGWYLINALWPGWLDINWGAIWPVLLIGIGLLILMRNRR